MLIVPTTFLAYFIMIVVDIMVNDKNNRYFTPGVIKYGVMLAVITMPLYLTHLAHIE